INDKYGGSDDIETFDTYADNSEYNISIERTDQNDQSKQAKQTDQNKQSEQAK
ncbi:25670_t:CDS:2, partial [Gigaspora margarita]